ncbi:MAG TPA: hypothetical protein VG674_27205 [Amycolatopsis sp.]|nr:hypothetical protein [Amycolatopsis sp.]
MTVTGDYRETTDWLRLPGGSAAVGGDAAAVTIGRDERIYVFNRGPQRMLIFEPDGTYAGGWGDSEDYVRPHGAATCADGDLLLVDVGAHVVDKVGTDGTRVARLGTAGRAAPAYSGEPFHQPTDAVEHPRTREIFVADGYGNSRIHRYDADGRHILSWGQPGSAPGCLSNPHGLCLLDDDHLAVCDRENYRIQIFDFAGDLVDSWHWHHPCAIRRGGDRLFVAELGPPAYLHGAIPDMGCCVTVADLDGTVIDRIGDRHPGLAVGQFFSPHGIAVTTDGVLYVAEVNSTYLSVLGRPVASRENVRCLSRWSPCAAELEMVPAVGTTR